MAADSIRQGEDVRRALARLVRGIREHLTYQQEQVWDGVPFDPAQGAFVIPTERSRGSSRVDAPGGPSPMAARAARPGFPQRVEQIREIAQWSDPRDRPAPQPPAFDEPPPPEYPGEEGWARRGPPEEATGPASRPVGGPFQAPVSPPTQAPVSAPTQAPVGIPGQAPPSTYTGKPGAYCRVSLQASAAPEQMQQAAGQLQQLREELGDCRRCARCERRGAIAFGSGSPRARLMLIGESPRGLEDQRGETYCGESPAGQLLESMLAVIGAHRDAIYMTHALKCAGKRPQPAEFAACEPFLQRQIALVQPELIVTLGSFPAQALLGCSTPLLELRGRWYPLGESWLLPTLHPHYILRHPKEKAKLWEDWQMVIHRLRERATQA